MDFFGRKPDKEAMWDRDTLQRVKRNDSLKKMDMVGRRSTSPMILPTPSVERVTSVARGITSVVQASSPHEESAEAPKQPRKTAYVTVGCLACLSTLIAITYIVTGFIVQILENEHILGNLQALLVNTTRAIKENERIIEHLQVMAAKVIKCSTE